jgi:putative ATP-dependent RNA helicase
MVFQILAQADKSRVLLLPIKENKTLFEGHIRLKDMPQGPRVFKFFVEKDVSKYLPPDDAIKLLRRANAIYLAQGDKALENKFIELLGAYQLSCRHISVCGHCLSEKKFTPLGKDAITYKGGRICENCAAAELQRESDFRGLSRSAKSHLARLLKKRRILDDILGLLSLEKLDPELTRFDLIPASTIESDTDLDDLNLPEILKTVLRKKLTRLLPVQSKSVQAGLLEGKSQLVVSATATGKSLIGEMAGLKNLLDGKGKFLFLVPLVALANQKFDQLSVYNELGFSISIRVGVSRIKLGDKHKIRQDLDADIIAGTYEGLDQVIRSRKDIGKVGTVVIDEVHMIEDADRGHRLSGLIARLRHVAPEAQFIFLSATVGNPLALGNRLKAVLVEYEARPVPIERHLIFSAGVEKRRLMRKLAKEAESKISSKGYKGQTIIFTNSRKNCHDLASSIPGAVAYHAGLQYFERKRIEDLFVRGEITTIVTTAALAAGVDFPASHVIFESLAMGINWLTVHEFSQMTGRAGRPGYHDKGLVYILAEPGRRFSSARGESEDEIALFLLHGDMENVAPEFSEEQQLEEVLANSVTARSREELDCLNESTIGLDGFDRNLETLAKAHLVKGIEPTRLGLASAAHFLSPDQTKLIALALQKDDPPLDVAVELESFEDLYLKFADRVSSALRFNISQRALHGSFLDLLSSPELNNLERKIQNQCLNFAKDFLRCSCMDAPYCNCPMRGISLRILELRMDGKSPSEIIDGFSEKYGMYAYQGDLVNYLDQVVRYLDAIEAIALVFGKKEAAKMTKELKKRIEGD